MPLRMSMCVSVDEAVNTFRMVQLVMTQSGMCRLPKLIILRMYDNVRLCLYVCRRESVAVFVHARVLVHFVSICVRTRTKANTYIATKKYTCTHI